MQSNLIGTELEKYDNEMEEPKFDNVEEYQTSVLLKKKKYDASITSTKNDTVEKVERSRENVNEKFNAYITSTKKNIDTVKKFCSSVSS